MRPSADPSLLLHDRFVEVENQASHTGVRGQLARRPAVVPRILAVAHILQRRVRLRLEHFKVLPERIQQNRALRRFRLPGRGQAKRVGDALQRASCRPPSSRAAQTPAPLRRYVTSFIRLSACKRRIGHHGLDHMRSRGSRRRSSPSSAAERCASRRDTCCGDTGCLHGPARNVDPPPTSFQSPSGW